ncbi:MAG: hypothetical protein ABL931_16090 [Usitatibacteraceae bacterium]
MTEPNIPPSEGEIQIAVPGKTEAVGWSEWALAILLTVLIALSAAALLSASIMELMFDSASAWIRIFVLLPVLLISSYLLVQLWQKLFVRRDAAKK